MHMLGIPAIKAQAEARVPTMVGCPSTSEALHLTAEGYAYIGDLRTNVLLLVEALEEAQVLIGQMGRALRVAVPNLQTSTEWREDDPEYRQVDDALAAWGESE